MLLMGRISATNRHCRVSPLPFPFGTRNAFVANELLDLRMRFSRSILTMWYRMPLFMASEVRKSRLAIGGCVPVSTGTSMAVTLFNGSPGRVKHRW